MKVSDLIKELKKFDGDLEVYYEYNTSDCTGHGPDEYCYCGYSDHRELVGTVDKCLIDTYAKKMKIPQIVLK